MITKTALLMLGIAGKSLNKEEIYWLKNPLKAVKSADIEVFWRCSERVVGYHIDD